MVTVVKCSKKQRSIVGRTAKESPVRIPPATAAGSSSTWISTAVPVWFPIHIPHTIYHIPHTIYHIPYTLYIPHTTAKQIQNAVIGQSCRHGGGRILRERVAGGVGNSGGEEAVLAPAADIMLPCEFFL